MTGAPVDSLRLIHGPGEFVVHEMDDNDCEGDYSTILRSPLVPAHGFGNECHSVVIAALQDSRLTSGLVYGLAKLFNAALARM
jgi:hypothetical protein